MAVLHHAFLCPGGLQVAHDLTQLSTEENLSAVALDAYTSLADREDLHRAFLLDPDGPVRSWMQPNFISPGLAALVILGGRMVEIPNLSASGDTNHYLLETQLPRLGWSAEDVALLVRGRPIETVLQSYADPARPVEPGGFRHTGGWTDGATAIRLKKRIDQLTAGLSPDAPASEVVAWKILHDSGALKDAQAMLAAIEESDWLVMAVTH